jgi:hypothetical protein
LIGAVAPPPSADGEPGRDVFDADAGDTLVSVETFRHR